MMQSQARLIPVVVMMLWAGPLDAATYEVGPGKAFASIGAVPWESLQAGDTVLIHWRTTPYREKWVIGRQGTAAAPITVRGVPGPNGELPVIDGSGATTRSALNFWNQNRAVIKIGGSNVPADVMPRYIVIERLDIKSGRAPHTFTAANGTIATYTDNAAAIFVEKGEHITVRQSILRDSGNGFFVASSDGAASRSILVEGNHIYDNGIANSIYHHNNYTAAIGITFQYNRFGPLRAGTQGANLKDRSAGLVVRYNWIEGGSRQLDLVDGEDSALIRAHPSYRTTFVYGNVLIEPAGAGNRQIVHYGGDSGDEQHYRKGTLHFFNNTIVSYRTDRNTVFRLSSNDERADFRNNVVYGTLPGNTQSLVDDTGILDMSHNWIKPGFVSTFNGTLGGVINDDGTTVTGGSPGFVNEAARDFRLAAGSGAVDKGTIISAAALPAHDLVREYVVHRSSQARGFDGSIDIGAFELASGQPAALAIATSSMPAGRVGTFYSAALKATGGLTPYRWSRTGGTLPGGLTLDSISGVVSGTPAAAGSSTFTARVTDAQAPPAAASRTLAISIAPRYAPLAITTASLPDARVGRDYRQTLQATGGLKPYAWSLASGSLPPGISGSASQGTLAGRPTKAGAWTFVVRVQDSQSPRASDTQTLRIRVTN
jgi:hypothetical protein